jgi:hypothetical protein
VSVADPGMLTVLPGKALWHLSLYLIRLVKLNKLNNRIGRQAWPPFTHSGRSDYGEALDSGTWRPFSPN